MQRLICTLILRPCGWFIHFLHEKVKGSKAKSDRKRKKEKKDSKVNHRHYL